MTQDNEAGTWVQPHDSTMTPAQRNASLVAALLLFLAGLFTLKEFLPALVWTVVFAIALWPLFQRLANRWPQHRRELLPMAFVAAIVLIFVIPLAMVAIPLAADGHAAAQYVQQVQKSGLPAPQFLGSLPYGAKLSALWQQHLSQPGQISTLAAGAVHGGGARVAGVVGKQTVHRIVLAGFMLLGLFLFLRDFTAVVEQVKVGARRAFGAAGEDVGRQIILSVHGTVNGLVLVGLGEGLILGIAYLVAGVPHSALFGMLTAVLAMVPFGAAVGFCIAAAVLLANGGTVGAIIIVVLGCIVTFVADHFIRPVLIGGATRLPFIWVLLGILGGISAWGLVGLFVGPAIMAALILLWREFVGAQPGPINPHPDDVLIE